MFRKKNNVSKEEILNGEIDAIEDASFKPETLKKSEKIGISIDKKSISNATYRKKRKAEEKKLKSDKKTLKQSFRSMLFLPSQQKNIFTPIVRMVLGWKLSYIPSANLDLHALKISSAIEPIWTSLVDKIDFDAHPELLACIPLAISTAGLIVDIKKYSKENKNGNRESGNGKSRTDGRGKEKEKKSDFEVRPSGSY